MTDEEQTVTVPEEHVHEKLNPGDNCPSCATRGRLRTGQEAYGLIVMKDYKNRLWCPSSLEFAS